MSLQTMLERDEGRKYQAYPDPLTRGDPWTIGIGHTGPEVHQGLQWDDTQIDTAFASDTGIAESECRANFPWFDQLNDARQAVLISMCFQMGIHRLLAFVNTLAMIGAGNYAGASDGMLDSVWAYQTPSRAARLAYQMKTGLWI